MLFNSFHFLCFFPIVTLLYFSIPNKMRWGWLLLCSYYFYMSWNPRYAILMAISTEITYLSGILIAKSNNMIDVKRRLFFKKMWVVLSLTSNLVILFFFKYFNFFTQSISDLLKSFGVEVLTPRFDVLLPVGISFYTFQALSYTIDVYRGEIYAEKNLPKYALFVSFFPQLVAGPIERSKNLLVQINKQHSFDYIRVKNGLLLMLWGYFQKIVIAERTAMIVDVVYNDYNKYSGFQIMFATVLFAFQIYCDFSGYSDIAIGAAQVLGYNLMDNFKRPYAAKSIQEFWRRWHISLSTWFRDYLYIPLGGSRCSKIKKYRNIMITFFASGLWHGAGWNYIIWGCLHGMYQIVGDFVQPHKIQIYKKLKIKSDSDYFRFGQIFITFVLVDFAWLFFRAPKLSIAFEMIHKILFEFNISSVFNSTLQNIGDKNLIITLVCIVFLILVNYAKNKVDIFLWLDEKNMFFRWGLYYSLVILIILLGEFGVNQFIYFQF